MAIRSPDRVAFLGILWCLAAGHPALAADNPDETGLQEITVTARRVVEPLQQTPVAITAFTAEALEARSVESSTDVLAFVPNVAFGSGYSGSNDAFFYIRGVGVNDFTAAIDPPVGLYVDGVYLGRTAGALFDLVDADSIEVLRGPQGTLFGRNSSGGAISINSRQPSGQWDGDLSVTYGERNLRSGRVALDLPLVQEVLTARVSGLIKQQDGWVRDAFNQRTLGDEHTNAVRAVVQWIPAQDLKITVAGDYSDSDNSPLPQILRGAVANSSSPCPPFCIPFPAGLANYASNSSSVSYVDEPFINHLKAYGGALTVQWDARPVTLKSITAYRKIQQDHWADYDGTPYDFYDDYVPIKQDQFSQELQFSGQHLDQRLRWVAGLYYFRERVDQTNGITFGATGPRGVLATPALVPLYPGGPVILPVAPLVVDPPTPGARQYRIVDDQRITPDSRSYALFGQSTFRLTDRLGATLGLRFTRDEKSQGYDFYVDNTIPNHPLYPVGLTQSILTSVRNDWHSFDPRVDLEYQLGHDITSYISYSTGYRAGGFDSRPVQLLITSFNPEKVRTGELGLKSEWLDRTLRVNADFFYTHYDDMQIPVLENGFFSIENAGRARISGVELELTARPVRQLEISASAGWLDAHFLSVTPDALAVEVLVSNALPMAPRWTDNASAQYTLPLAKLGTVILRADYSYISQRRTYANDAPGNSLDAHSLVNLRASWMSPQDAWTFAVLCRNCTNRMYLNWSEDVRNTASPLGVWDVYPAPPREWSARVEYRF